MTLHNKIKLDVQIRVAGQDAGVKAGRAAPGTTYVLGKFRMASAFQYLEECGLGISDDFDLQVGCCCTREEGGWGGERIASGER